MAEDVLQFVRYGVFGERLRDVQHTIKLEFLPALVLAARDDPQQLHCVLAGVEDHRCVCTVLRYASLDYGEVIRNLKSNLSMEQEDPMEDDDCLFDREENANVDECLLFEKANERERAGLALESLQRNALRSSCDMGSIFNNVVYVSELRILLSVAASRCPDFLSPELLVKGLINTSCGVELLVATMANNPDVLDKTCEHLIELIKSDLPRVSNKSPSISGPSSSRQSTSPKLKDELQTAVWILYKLCHKARSFALICRRLLVEKMVLEEMVLLITFEVLQDALEFLSYAMLKSQRRSQWLLSYFLSTHKSALTFPPSKGEGKLSARAIDKEWLLQELRKFLLKDAKRIKQEQGWTSELQAHLKLYCIVIRTGDMHPTFEEIDFWLKTLVQDKSNPISISQRKLELGVVFLCLVPGLSTGATRGLYHACVSYLLSPVKQPNFCRPTVELAVWLTVQLFLRNFSNIAEFVRESLGVHVTVHNALMRDLAESAVTGGITSEPSVIANAVVSLRPHGKEQSRTLMCLEQLFHANTFSRCGVDILGAVIYCVSRAREPVPHRLVHVIQCYVDLPVQQANGKSPVIKAGELEPFLIETISPAIHFLGSWQQNFDSPASDSIAPAALATYIVLCREHLLRSLGMFNEGACSPTLISCIPWKLFLAYMERSWSDYEGLLPKWLGLATSLFPEKFSVLNMLDQMELREFSSETNAINKISTVDNLEWIDNPDLSIENMKSTCKKAFTEPLLVFQLLEAMRRRASNYNWDLKEVVENPGYWNLESTFITELAPLLLDPTCSHRLQMKFCEWWHILPDAAKDVLVLVLFKAVRVPSSYTGFQVDEGVLEYSALLREPLLFLSCDHRLFLTPLLRIFLDTLMEILTANRRLCEASVLEKEGGLRREEVAAALVVQDSAVCQILLEHCVVNKCTDNSSTLYDTRKLVCDFISWLFHVNDLLLKLLHFQGYDMQLIPVMVEHIPIMVQCLDFLEELLQQQMQFKQVFAVNLTSRVSCRYPEDSRSLPIAEEVISHVVHVKSTIAGSSEFLRQVCQTVAEIAITFPSLASKVVEFLQSCAQAGASLNKHGPPRDPKLEAAACTAFKTLVRRKVIYGQVPLDDEIA